MKGIKEAFIDAGEISQMLGIGMTKAYVIIKEYNAELEAKGYFTMRGKCQRKLMTSAMGASSATPQSWDC